MPPTDYLISTRLTDAHGFARLWVTMTRARTSEVLFAEAFTFAEAQLPERRQVLIGALVSRLASVIDHIELAEMRRSGEASAYVHFLLGCEQMQSLDLPAMRRARKHFKKASELSPSFTSALGMLARTLCLEWVLLDRSDKDLLQSALELASRATRIDPLDPTGYREMGHAKLYLNALDESVTHLSTAVERAPGHADVLVDYADSLLHSMGDLTLAGDLISRALELNPAAPDPYNWIGATVDFFKSDYAEARAKLMRLSNKQSAARLIAAVAGAMGDVDTAKEYREIFMTRHPEFRLANWHLPLRGEAARQKYLDALRNAGFS